MSLAAWRRAELLRRRYAARTAQRISLLRRRGFSSADEHDELALQRTLPDNFQQLRGGAAEKFFELLGELAGQHDRTVGKDAAELAEKFFHAIRRFVEHERAVDV